MNIRAMILAAGSALALGVAGPAMAAEVLVGDYTLDQSSFGTGLGVHSNGTQSGSTVYGHVNQDGSGVTFHSDSGSLALNGGGEAIIDGDPLLQDLLVSFDKTWGAITFNLLSPTGREDDDFTSANFSLLVNGSALFTALGGTPNCAFCIVDNGENKFTVTGPGISTLAFAFDMPIGEAKQFRVEAVDGGGGNEVPEPATWALMIVGFGAAGSMLRRMRAVTARA